VTSIPRTLGRWVQSADGPRVRGGAAQDRSAVKEYSYWRDASPSQQSTVDSSHVVDRSRRRDVVIVGAGYTGLSAARTLARAGADVLVLECEEVGSGASSRNAGQVLTGLRLDSATLVRRYGAIRARQLFETASASIARLETLIADEGIECQYERVGHIQAAATAAHFKDLRDQQTILAQVFGHRVELVSRAEQRTELGSDVYHGLLVDERSGALNPARYVHGLAVAATRAGATLAAGVAVTDVRRDSSRWTVSTSAGPIDARDVLFATNGYTDRAAPFLQRRYVPIGSYIVVTAPLPADRAASLLPRRRTAFDSKHFLHYFRLTPDGRLLFGGRAEFSRPTAETTRQAAGILRRDMERVFPQLAGTSIEYAWGGLVAFTRDQLPHAGKLNGRYYAGGYCGHGIAMATSLGEAIARRIAGEAIEHPLFDDRFPAIPLYSGNPWFLPFVGAYYRLRDLLG
jgi:glycine/D-amino acid oxidase-like deaminating enzyme